jgi:hypothetical protein
MIALQACSHAVPGTGHARALFARPPNAAARLINDRY